MQDLSCVNLTYKLRGLTNVLEMFICMYSISGCLGARHFDDNPSWKSKADCRIDNKGLI